MGGAELVVDPRRMTSVKFRLGTSMPSLSHWLTKTMATLEDAARAAAAAALVPSLYCTLAPGTLARIAFKGDEGSQIAGDQQGGHGLPSIRAAPPTGCTWAEPPPESTATSAFDPITAMDARFVASGSTPVFFRRTAPCSSISWAMAASPVASMA